MRVNKSIFSVLFLLISTHFFIFHLLNFEPHFYNHTDGGENLVAAFTLYKYNTYSINLEPHAGYKREPLYPFLMSLIFRGVSFFSPQTYEQFPGFDAPAFNYLKFINVLLLFFTGFCAYSFLKDRFKNSFLPLFAFTSILYSGSLLYSSKQFLTEILASLLILLISFPYLSNWMTRSRKFFFFWGLATTALVFTKAVYLYLMFPVMAYWLFIYFKSRDKNFLIKGLIYFSIVFICASAWMTRNYFLGGGFEMTGRKDEMLYNRAIYNEMRPQEYPFTYILWTPGLRKFFLNDQNKENWERLWNWRGNDEVFLLAYAYVDGVVRKQYPVLPNGSFPLESVKKVEKEAWEKILSNPIGHGKMFLAFIYRSLYPEDGTGLEYFGIKIPREPDYDKRGDVLFLGLLNNIPYWIGFLWLLFLFLKKRSYQNLGFFLCPLYLVTILSLVGFSHFRFIYPLIPILSVGLAIFIGVKFKNSSLESILEPKVSS